MKKLFITVIAIGMLTSPAFATVHTRTVFPVENRKYFIPVMDTIYMGPLGESVNSAEIVDDSIAEADLDMTGSATDEYVLTFESDSGGDFAWEAPSALFAAGTNLTWTDAFTLDATTSALTEEQVEDFVGGMLGGTETLITVTYEDGTNDIDFVVDNDLSNYDWSSAPDALSDQSTKGVCTFITADFDDNGSGLVGIDYTNGQKATSGQHGFLTSTDWTTFNGHLHDDQIIEPNGIGCDEVTDFNFTAAGHINIRPNGDTDDYVKFDTDAHQTSMRFMGQNGIIVSQSGTTNFATDNLGNIGTITATTFTDGTASVVGGAGSGFTSFVVDSITLNEDDITSSTGDVVVAGSDDLLVSDGKLGIGFTLSPTELLEVQENADHCQAVVTTYGVNKYSMLLLRASDSDTLGTKTEFDDNDQLGGFYVKGVDTGAFDFAAGISVFQDGVPGTRVPGEMALWTCHTTNFNTGVFIDAAGDFLAVDSIAGTNMSGVGEFALFMDNAGRIGPTSSSIEVKENVREITNSNRIYDLRPVEYDRIGGDPNLYGLIAEEVAAVMPEVVRYKVEPVYAEGPVPALGGEEIGRYIHHYEKTNEPAGIHWERVTALLLDQIQKLEARVAELEK